MIGLSYILKIHDVSQKDIARILNIRKQNIGLWITDITRKIPEKHLPILSDIFNISPEYFQKELSDIDKLKLQKIKLISECNKLGLKLEEL